LVISFTIVILPSVVSAAAVKSIKLSELVARSNVIVIATVTKIDVGGNDVAAAKIPPLRLATADVIETWKGPRTRDITFVASPRHYCDIASAKKGERLVLFLERHENSPIMTIAHVGRGRMLLQEVKSEQFATIDDKIALPAGTRTVEILEVWTFRELVPKTESGEEHWETYTDSVPVRMIELRVLRGLVQGYLSAERPGNQAMESPLREAVKGSKRSGCQT